MSLLLTLTFGSFSSTFVECGRQECFGGSSHGVPVQPCGWRYKDTAAHHPAHEVQCVVW